MKKAGTKKIVSRNELTPPVWLSFAQLLFAAVLLYVMRNPVLLESQNKSNTLASLQPAFVIHIPIATAVAAPAKPPEDDLPL